MRRPEFFSRLRGRALDPKVAADHPRCPPAQRARPAHPPVQLDGRLLQDRDRDLVVGVGLADSLARPDGHAARRRDRPTDDRSHRGRGFSRGAIW
jgi:hypothetical protein